MISQSVGSPMLFLEFVHYIGPLTVELELRYDARTTRLSIPTVPGFHSLWPYMAAPSASAPCFYCTHRHAASERHETHSLPDPAFRGRRLSVRGSVDQFDEASFRIHFVENLYVIGDLRPPARCLAGLVSNLARIVFMEEAEISEWNTRRVNRIKTSSP